MSEVGMKPFEDDRWYLQRCPKCGSTHLAVVAELWAVLSEDGADTMHDECPNHDQTWDESSMMQCLECRHSGKAERFVHPGMAEALEHPTGEPNAQT